MQLYCHRCGGDLAADTTFCPHCGAPQLTLPLEQQSPEHSAQQPGTAPGPPPPPRAIDWPLAMRCAAVVAALGAVLSVVAIKLDVLRPISSIWGFCAAVLTLALYQRRQPAARMDGRIGARIGGLTGLALAIAVAVALASLGCVERFLLHGMGTFDAEVGTQIAQAQQQAQQWMASHAMPAPPDVVAFEKTPEYRLFYILSQFAIKTVVLVVISAVGGAFGGLLRARRR